MIEWKETPRKDWGEEATYLDYTLKVEETLDDKDTVYKWAVSGPQGVAAGVVRCSHFSHDKAKKVARTRAQQVAEALAKTASLDLEAVAH